ncbi:MAG: orotate phosphoribosyltransferase [Candidatus Margulisbacteria bacterium]|nr:orotate phosphoribosyltransferase [Candidatus Margulisiibacteriota bacterium]
MYDQLKQLLKDTGAVKTGDFTLSSGKKSNFYVDGKQVTCHPLGLKLMADIILDKIKGMKVDAVGGLTIGADPIAAAVAIQSQGKIAAFIVRKEAKGHGLGKEIEGIIKPGWKVVVVDAVTCAIPGAKHSSQAEENISVADMPLLTDETMTKVRELYNTNIRKFVHQYW